MANHKKYELHPEVITRSCEGMVVRFRKVNDVVYIPVKDLRDLLSIGGSQIPIYQICASSAKIEFYTRGDGLTAIQPWDIDNLIKGGMRRRPDSTKVRRAIWAKEMAKQIKNEDHAPENALKIFDSPEFGQVRVQIHDNEPVFCLPDVCRALELNPSKVAQRLTKDVLLKYTLETPGGNQLVTS